MLFCPTWDDDDDDVFLVTISNKKCSRRTNASASVFPHTLVSSSSLCFSVTSRCLECNAKIKAWLRGSTKWSASFCFPGGWKLKLFFVFCWRSKFGTLDKLACDSGRFWCGHLRRPRRPSAVRAVCVCAHWKKAVLFFSFSHFWEGGGRFYSQDDGALSEKNKNPCGALQSVVRFLNGERAQTRKKARETASTRCAAFTHPQQLAESKLCCHMQSYDCFH